MAPDHAVKTQANTYTGAYGVEKHHFKAISKKLNEKISCCYSNNSFETSNTNCNSNKHVTHNATFILSSIAKPIKS